jgi:diguanylate cyclase (GGDEF)-like protein/hemerythrin-like metal-binding protein/PAS domain S-box-containing protein
MLSGSASTKERELAERYKFLTDNMADCIWLLDFNTGRFKYISPAVVALRGLTPEEAMEESLEEALTPESLEKMKAITAEFIPRFLADDPELEGRKFIYEFQQFHKDGHLVDVEMSIQVLKTKVPGEIEIIGVTRDISERKTLEQALLKEIEAKNQLIEQLKASENQLSDLSMALKLKNETLEKVTITDQLTGAFNRFYFEKRAMGEIERSRRYGTPLSLLIFDLDFFKKINDQWGHGFGDSVLKRMSVEVMSTIRSTDLFARWGGEEFVVLMPGTDQRHAVMAAEKLRKALSQVLHPTIGRVTASFGVAEHRYGEQLENWFTRADRAMYRSKSHGRNLVSEWSDHAYLTESSEMTWNEEWASGNTLIDEAHKTLLSYANGIVAMMQQDVPSDELMKGYDQLLDHVASHFEEEEAILKQVGYPAVTFHERFHQHLLSKGLQVKKRLLEGHVVKSDMILFLMDEIIVGHLLTEDVKFVPWLRGEEGI